MTKQVIAIVSVLKPVDDSRNYEKIGFSLGNTNKYAINIIGFSTKNIHKENNISFHPLFSFKRNSIKRLGSSWKIHKKLIQVKPDIIIVNTPELLPVIVLNKILFGCKIIYDVQEDYFKNILYTTTYPFLIRFPLATLTRLIERLSGWFIDGYFFAEKIYQKDMPFIAKKGILLENKSTANSTITRKNRRDPNDILLIYTGTISDHYGIFDAIEFVTALNQTNKGIRLRIIGYCAKSSVYNKLLNMIHNKPYIKIIGGNSLIPHNQILMELSKADFCLLPYKHNKSTHGRIPTKVYECLSMEVPMIIREKASWADLCLSYNACIISDFKSTDRDLSNLLIHKEFYDIGNKNDISWEAEAPKLIKFIENMI